MTDYNFEDAVLPPVTSMAPVPPPAYSVGPSDIAASFDPGGVPSTGEENQGLLRLAAASRKATEYDGVAQGRLNALYDAANKRNASIKAATGEEVGNPYLAVPLTGTELDDPYASPSDKTALSAYARENQNYQPGQILDAQGQERIKQLRLSNYQSELERLSAKYPDQTATIAADKPLIDEAQALTASALAEQAAAKQAAPGVVAPFVASMAGGLVGAFRDPMQAGALFAGGPELQAIKALRFGGPILARMIGDGFLNAGIAASAQPEVQQWRAERGQEYGWVPALQDVGMNFLFGAAIGGAVGTVHMATTPAHVDLVNRAMSGDMNAAREVAKVLTKEHAPDLHAFLEADGHDSTATAERQPDHVSEAELERSYQQAIRHHEDPSEPLPELLPTIDRRHTDTAAREAIAAAPDQSPLDVLRSDPDLARSALVSDDPGLQKAGRLASMGDDAFDMVRQGQVDPNVAAEVAARVNQPDEQAAILRQVAQDRGVTPQRAAQAVSEIMDQRALPESLTRLLGNDGARFGEVPAIDYGNRSVTARMFAGEIRGDLGADVPGTLVSTFLRDGQEVLHGIPAYHGTPHDFDRFDLGKIGTGEGAQAYGHGLYFAERRGIAEDYQRRLSLEEGRVTVNGQPFDESNPLHQAADFLTNNNGNHAEAIKHIDQVLDTKTLAPEYKTLLEDAKNLLTSDQENVSGSVKVPLTESANAGHLYTVRIARDPEHFLDWDKPLGEQSEIVKQFIIDYAGGDRGVLNEYSSAGDYIKSLVQEEMDSSAASDLMREYGIAGIKYHDAGSRTAAEGTRNYVVFNDRDIHITHKNDVPVAREQPLPEFLKTEAKAQFADEMKAAGVRSKDFDADLTQRATALLDSDTRLDHASAFEEAAVERAGDNGREIFSEPASRDGSQIEAASFSSLYPEGAEADRGSGGELRRAGETGGDAGSTASAADAGTGRGRPRPADTNTDSLDLIPIADREDATDVRMIPRDEVLSAEPRESFLADLIDACKV